MKYPSECGNVVVSLKLYLVAGLVMFSGNLFLFQLSYFYLYFNKENSIPTHSLGGVEMSLLETQGGQLKHGWMTIKSTIMPQFPWLRMSPLVA